MGLRQLHTAETMFIDDGLTDGAVFPPSSNAVYDALQNAIELPSVTAEDDGDVLTVVSGAWAKATPSGGGGVFAVHEIYDEVEGTTTLDKTWQEIHDAITSGQIANIISEYGSNVESYYVWGAFAPEENSFLIQAICYFATQDGLSLGYYDYITNSANEYPVRSDD